MTYQPNQGAGLAYINGKERVLDDWAVFDSPYV